MSNSPEVSVVICVYNAEDYLPQAIESIQNQSLRNIELILIDDGSSDHSLEILRRYEQKDDRCRVITGPNQGIIGSRNMGIQMARGEYIAIMDADDICAPERLSLQLLYMKEHEECVVVGSRGLLIDPENRPIMPFLVPLTHEEIDSAHLSGLGGSIMNPSAMIRKSAFFKVGMYKKEYLHAEDIDLYLRLAEVGKLANLPEIFLQYRQHPASIGYKHSKMQQISTVKAVTAARQRRGLLAETFIESPKIHLSEQTPLADIYAKWAWWALGAGNLATAKRYGFRAFLLRPFKKTNFKLIFCLLRGR